MAKDTNIFIIESRIQRQRLKDMKDAAKRRKIKVSDKFRQDTVTHIVTEFQDTGAVLRKLGISSIEELGDVELVSVSWFTECMKANKVVEVLDTHRIKPSQTSGAEAEVPRSQAMPEYACQRATPLKHYNEKFTTALEVLEKHAELRDEEHDYSRALAFRRASCVLKCLPAPLTSIQQLRHTLNIGDHSRRVIQEVLEEGHCEEVDAILADSWFHKMKLFSSVFGIGPSTAKKWIEKGWQTIEDAQQLCTSSDWRVQWGLGFHGDLMTPVVKQEAGYLVDIVRRHVETLLPGAILQLTGGFRRGKEAGHDVDILITHPTEGREIGLLPRLVHSLQSHDIILCGKYEKSTYSDNVLTTDFKLTMRGQLDHFEKWLGIVKVPKSVREKSSPAGESVLYQRQNTQGNNELVTSTEGSIETDNNRNHSEKTPLELSKEPRDWLARRVDLIVSPYSQYFYALVGWTGNKQFNRDLRWYAQKEMGMKLTSHGLYDFNKAKKLPASSEQEVFDHLLIPYREPAYRNC